MDKHISADFEIGAWDENPFDEAVGVGCCGTAIFCAWFPVDLDRFRHSV